MAIKIEEVEKIVESRKNAPFTPEELELISDVEEYIDAKIVEHVSKTARIEIKIDECYCLFRYSPRKYDLTSTIADVRSRAMALELRRRYAEAGWKINAEIAESMFNGDFWVFTKNNKI